MIINVHTSYCTVHIIDRFTCFFFNKMRIFMKIHLVGAKMFHVDGQTDRQTQTHTHIYEKLLLASSCLSAHTHIYIYIYADRHEEANSNFS